MRIVRLATAGGARWALERGDAYEILEGDPYGRPRGSGKKIPARKARLLAPVRPTKIVAIGLNDRRHAEEMGKPLPGEPLLFLKPPSAVVGPGSPIRIGRTAHRIDHEAEIGVVLSRTARNVPAARALRYVLGYTCVNDVTDRDLQKRDVQYTRAKGFDTFCPVGPWIETRPPRGALRVFGRVNGELRQEGSTEDLIFSIPRLVSFVSSVMTLNPGDLISCGTFRGVGPIHPGDRVEIEVRGVGVLRNPVR